MKPSLSAYQRVRLGDRVAYVKPDALNHLGDIGAIIFDCDGVLIDTRKSYNKAIGRTVCFILSQLTGLSFPQRVITQPIIYKLRSSGGFNSDWDSTYVILLYIFSRLPPRFLQRFRQAEQELVDPGGHAVGCRAQLDQLGHQLRGAVKKHQLREAVERVRAGLSRFAERADSSGISSLESVLLTERQPVWRMAALGCFKALLAYPEKAGESLLATVFDEIFYGPELFQPTHGRPPQFYSGPGAIENETLIVTASTLKRLAAMVGRSNLGIASGRGTAATDKTLGRLSGYFNPKARVHLEDEELSAPSDPNTLRVERAKPAPYSLLTSARAMKEFRRALYVGDSAEDLIMARRANEVDPRYLFAGVTDYGHDPGRRRKMFVEAAVDLILPSVNQLPELLRTVRRGEAG